MRKLGGRIRSCCTGHIPLGRKIHRCLRRFERQGVPVIVTAANGQGGTRTTLDELGMLSCFRKIFATSRVKGNGSRPSVCFTTLLRLSARPRRA